MNYFNLSNLYYDIINFHAEVNFCGELLIAINAFALRVLKDKVPQRRESPDYVSYLSCSPDHLELITIQETLMIVRCPDRKFCVSGYCGRQ